MSCVSSLTVFLRPLDRTIIRAGSGLFTRLSGSLDDNETSAQFVYSLVPRDRLVGLFEPKLQQT